MKNILVHIICIALLFGSCQKIESSITAGNNNTDPIYLVNGSQNGSPINLTVNDTNVFLENGIRNMHELTLQYSEIKNTSTNEALRVILSPNERAISDIENIPNNDREIEFLVHEPTCLKLNFNNNSEVESSFSYLKNNQWNNDVHLGYNEYGKYEIQCRMNGLSNETYTLQINNGFNGIIFNADFNLFQTSNDLAFSAHSKSNEFYHKWTINGVDYGDQAEKEFNLESGIYVIIHEISDKYGNSEVMTKLFNVFVHDIKWVSEITLCSEEKQSSHFDQIIVEYEKNGQLFSSAYLTENNLSTATLSDFDIFNEGENIAVKFNCKFNCKLANANQSEFMDLHNISGTFKYLIK